MEPYSKIPIPLSQRWKEVRIRLLPALVFLITGLIVFNLWNHRISSANMTGKVIGAHAELRSSEGGYLTQLKIQRFQRVKAGDVIAEVVHIDPKVLEANLALILAEVEMIRMGMGTMDSKQRNMLNQEELQMDLMNQRIELATSGIHQQRAEREYNRVKKLFDADMITEVEYDLAKSERDAINMEIEQKTLMLETMEERFKHLSLNDSDDELTSGSSVAAAIKLEEERLKLIEAEMKPIPLVAPIDGMVNQIYRTGGEQIIDGEIILTIQSPKPDYIVGYLPHPMRMEPEIGMPVIVRSRSNDRQEYDGKVLDVGVQVGDMVEVTNMVSQVIQTGLPIKITLGEDTNLRPGEIVDLTLRPL
ncbi:MAG: HlyD family efflux transporter periplasmic adaptor subunit [Balneolales bacterium]